RFAHLTVISDVTGPTLVAADGSDSPTSVTVSFSEQVSAATATNIANYRITNMSAGTLLTISKAVLSKGTNVILTTAARVDGVTYLLVASNVQDLSSRANPIAPNSAIPISSEIT